MGAGALWACDHLFWPRPILECMTTLAVAATATGRVPLGTCVLQLPLRRAAAVAKQASALQLLSGGRFVLGVGVGDHPAEFAAAGVDVAPRGRRLDEALAELGSAWASAEVAEGSFGQRPGSPPVPVWIGGSSDAAVERAARVGEGWVPLFVTPEEYAAGLARLRRRAAAHGRDPAEITAAVVVTVRVGGESALEEGTRWLSSLFGPPPRAFERHLIAGVAPRCAEGIGRYLEAGAEHVVVMVASDATVESFAELTDTLAPGVVAARAPAGSEPLAVEVS